MLQKYRRSPKRGRFTPNGTTKERFRILGQRFVFVGQRFIWACRRFGTF